jgi:hypothetical protein
VAKHSINLGHWIQVQNTIILAKKMRLMDWILREVTEIDLHPNNMNREDSFSLIRAWWPLICDLKEWRQSFTKKLTLSSGPWKGLTLCPTLLYPPFF